MSPSTGIGFFWALGGVLVHFVSQPTIFAHFRDQLLQEEEKCIDFLWTSLNLRWILQNFMEAAWRSGECCQHFAQMLPECLC